MFRRSPLEMRVLLLAPVGRDAELLVGTLTSLQIETAISRDAETLLLMLSEGAGSAIIAEEAITPALLQELDKWLKSQPAWSDMPFIILTFSGSPTQESHCHAQELQLLGNFTLIERPARPDTVQSSVRAVLRARMRQYAVSSRQEALIQANADLEQFAYSASHDLKEPLRTIAIYSELLVRSYGPLLDEKGQEFVTLIQSGIKRMDALLADLLSYAHASSISGDGIEPIHAIGPLEAALDRLAGAIHESDAQISLGEMPYVRMRESHLSQIFQNLIGNAIKYRKENETPLIQVSATKAGVHWLFSIADNGIGVPPDYKETIFGIFKRLHSNSKYSGTGMGLAICQRIVERYQGRIWVESAPGKGSNFFFTIPG